MKAFKVQYTAGGIETSMIVLCDCDDESNLEQALADKDSNFRIGNEIHSKLHSKREIPLSNVLVKDLSITELLTVLRKEITGGNRSEYARI